jgi:hypothetical protein
VSKHHQPTPANIDQGMRGAQPVLVDAKPQVTGGWVTIVGCGSGRPHPSYGESLSDVFHNHNTLTCSFRIGVTGCAPGTSSVAVTPSKSTDFTSKQ